MWNRKGWRLHTTTGFYLAEVVYGKADITGRYVYSIAHAPNGCLYIGQSVRSLRLRLREHVHQYTPIGLAFKGLASTDEDWVAEVYTITGDLDAAERHYIQVFQPPYNRYHRGAP